MDTEIIVKNKTPLYQRTEIIAKITFQGPTPDGEAVRQAISSKLKADAKLVKIERISTDYGFPGAKVTASVYDNSDALETYAPKIGKKAKENIAKAEEEKKAAAEKPKEEPKAEPAKEEKPAEEKPTEKKEEPAEKEAPKAEAAEKKEEPAEKPAEKGE